MAPSKSSAPGKIILTGEYAVLFGYPGIAIPAPLSVTAQYEEDTETKNLTVTWPQMEGRPEWQQYLKQIIARCGTFGGSLTIESDIPLGKGMGSSTALIVAVCRCLLGEDCEEKALTIEDELNPGHSGIDFAVIWNGAPVLFTKGSKPTRIDLRDSLLTGAILIDTGEPNEETPELVAWVSKQKDVLTHALDKIGSCAERLRNGEDLKTIIHDHNLAQQELGIVTTEAKELITKIEQLGGAAKVIGAGSRTGGCGMVLAIDCDASCIDNRYPVFPL